MLTGFAEICDVITFEFENLPSESIAYLASLKPVHPGQRALEITQDRFTEKSFVQSAGSEDRALRGGFFAATMQPRPLPHLGGPAILKTRRLGYDGKGQAKVASAEEAVRAFESFKAAPAILEGFVDFAFEASVVAARSAGRQLRGL